MKRSIRVAGMTPESIVDGVGLRFTLYVQGCPHVCAGCHNPQTHPSVGGREMEPEKIFALIEQNPLLQGVTFSGGEPFAQAGALLSLARMIRDKGLHLCCYSGWTFEQLLQKSTEESDIAELLRLCHVLVDGPFILEQRTLQKRFIGSRNQRCLNIPNSLAARMPILQQNWQ